MSFADNQDYKIAFQSQDKSIILYEPADKTKYHTNRYIAAGCIDIYAQSGATKETLQAVINKILELCNEDKPVKTFRTDIGTLCNNLLYRMRYPVDEDCSIRLGATLFFIEGENPDLVNPQFTDKKVELAHNNADLYSFFLTEGISAMPSYRELLDTLTDTEYLSKRKQTLAGLMLPQ